MSFRFSRPMVHLLCLWGMVVTGFSQLTEQVERAEEAQREARGGRDREEAQMSRGEADSSDALDAMDDTPMGVDVGCLMVVSHQNEAETFPEAAGEEMIQISEALDAPERLAEILSPYLGKPISMRLLAELARDVDQAWRESEYPLVDVYYPEQNITQGKLQLVVREAVLGEKRMENDRPSRKEDYLLSQIRTQPGDRVNSRHVEADLDWLNENPARRVDLLFERGQQDGTSDIILQSEEVNPFSAYLGIANSGIDLTGEQEWSLGWNWANPFQTESAVGYHFSTDLDGDALQAHTVVGQVYLPWRHILEVIGAYVETDATSAIGGSSNTLLGVEGQNIQASVDYRVPLPRVEWARAYRHSVTAAFDYKRVDSDLLFGGTSFFANEVSIGQFRFEYEGAFPDSEGRGWNWFTAGIVLSPGDLFQNNTDGNFDLARVNSTANYGYLFADYHRRQKLPRGFSLLYQASAQGTTDRLASTEQLLAGGYRSVRGFDESEARGDSGILNSVEVEGPGFSLSRWLGSSRAVDQTTLLGFFDSARLAISDAGENGESEATLRSA
ncbi:MAG: ShlB/FhaC/HecB family hemolysin secretion/activation protein, partial [Verrucomicrobiota bacterium]